MQNTPTFMPPEPTNRKIEVTVDQDDGTFQTDLFCALNHCGKNVNVFSDGSRTIHASERVHQTRSEPFTIAWLF